MEAAGEGILTLSPRRSSGDPPDQPFEGLVVPGLGVVALNLPDPLCETDPNNQKGSAEGSFGLLLPGLELRVKDGSGESEASGISGQLEVAGVTGEWHTASPRLCLDDQGFIFPEDNVSGESSS